MATCTVPEMQTKITYLLKSLGTGPHKIAECLRVRKIKGYMGDVEECPIAKLVKKHFRSLENVGLNYDAVEFALRGEEGVVHLPKAVIKFIDKFDVGDYPKITLDE